MKAAGRESRAAKLARGVPRYLVETPEESLPAESTRFTLRELRWELSRVVTPQEKAFILSALLKVAERKAARARHRR